MKMRFRLTTDFLLEIAPHLLGTLALAILGETVSEGGFTRPAPLWARWLFVAIAMLLFPLCFIAGQRTSPHPVRRVSAVASLFNGVFAALSGVSVAMLGVSAFLEETLWLTGASTPDQLIGGPLLLGGTLGLLSYLAGHTYVRFDLRGI